MRRKRITASRLSVYGFICFARKRCLSTLVPCGVLFVVFILFCVSISHYRKLSIPLENVAAFQIRTEAMTELYALSDKYHFDFIEELTYYCLEHHFFDTKAPDFVAGQMEQTFTANHAGVKRKYSKKQIQPYYDLLRSIYDEIKYFPIPADLTEEDQYVYTDGWGVKRNYDGERIHLGTDILDRQNIRGRIPIVSMTDGIVENIGWNNRGGWRVGIRSAAGHYYYYAHLENYATALNNGIKIKAGDILGYMGDTGYSPIEGTTGNFAVHLHVGISPKTTLTKDEFWINPYPFLKMVEGNKCRIDAN